jgi:hypothetical protein
VAPPIGEQEREEGDFAVAIEVAPFDLVLPEAETPRALERSSARDRRPGQALRDERELGSSFLVGERGQPAPLRRIDVRVSWVEGFGERAVARTTYGLDAEAVQEQIAALAEASASRPDGGAGPTDGGEPQAGPGGRRKQPKGDR